MGERVTKRDLRQAAACAIPSITCVVPALKQMTELVDSLSVFARSEVTPDVIPQRKRGRHPHHLLNEVRYYLDRGGFELDEIVSMVSDGPLGTEDQRFEASERVRVTLHGAGRRVHSFDW
jgi:hypothetical protein